MYIFCSVKQEIKSPIWPLFSCTKILESDRRHYGPWIMDRQMTKWTWLQKEKMLSFHTWHDKKIENPTLYMTIAKAADFFGKKSNSNSKTNLPKNLQSGWHDYNGTLPITFNISWKCTTGISLSILSTETQHVAVNFMSFSHKVCYHHRLSTSVPTVGDFHYLLWEPLKHLNLLSAKSRIPSQWFLPLLLEDTKAFFPACTLGDYCSVEHNNKWGFYLSSYCLCVWHTRKSRSEFKIYLGMYS